MSMRVAFRFRGFADVVLASSLSLNDYLTHCVCLVIEGEMNTLARGFVIWLDVAGDDASSFWIAFTWWCLFMFVMYLIILNLLVVLVLEVFEQTKGKMRSKTTLCAQISQIMALRRLKDAGGITLEDIKDVIEDSSDDGDFESDNCCYTCCRVSQCCVKWIGC